MTNQTPTPNTIMLTKNTDILRLEVAKHVAADTIIQGNYWDPRTKSGCFFGCLSRSDNPRINEDEYGLPIMVQRIGESIFESLPSADAKAFFAALPDAVSCNGKDLSKVGSRFLAAELRSLPEQDADIQTVIDPVITGMDLLAAGEEWPEAAAAAREAECATRGADAPLAALAAADFTSQYTLTAWTALVSLNAARNAAQGAADTTDTSWFAQATLNAQAAHAAQPGNARIRQRDLLLRLIAAAPVVAAELEGAREKGEEQKPTLVFLSTHETTNG